MKSSVRIKTKKLVTVSLLIGAQIVLSRFLSITTPIVKIGFSFLPVVILAILYGPLQAGISAAISDILGALLFPAGAYFPGFTVTAFCAGVLYGVFLYQKPKKLVRVLLAAVAVSLMELVFNTVNLYFLTGQGIWAILPMRLVQSVIMMAVKTVTIWNVAYWALYIQGGKKSSKK